MINKIKNKANALLLGGLSHLQKQQRQHYFDNFHIKYASDILCSIESYKGKTNNNDIKLSNEYALDVYGSKKYAPWLYVYSAVNSEFKEGWIPSNYYHGIVVPATKGDYGKVSYLKPLSHIILQNQLLPDIGYFVNGLFFDINKKLIDILSLKNHLFQDTDKIVFKADNIPAGGGVVVFTDNNFDIEKVCKMGSGVFQSYIKQHSFFDNYMPNSVGTIRLTTALDKKGVIELRASFLRFGMKNDTHVQSNCIMIPINVNTGELNKIGHIETATSWTEILKHPSTNTLFEGNIIPYFDQCKDIAISLHKKIPFVQCIGWDMVINENNEVNIMEWNGYNNGITYSEATQGPSFSDLGWENLWKK